MTPETQLNLLYKIHVTLFSLTVTVFLDPRLRPIADILSDNIAKIR
jgi:hypothetical protein